MTSKEKKEWQARMEKRMMEAMQGLGKKMGEMEDKIQEH